MPFSEVHPIMSQTNPKSQSRPDITDYATVEAICDGVPV